MSTCILEDGPPTALKRRPVQRASDAECTPLKSRVRIGKHQPNRLLKLAFQHPELALPSPHGWLHSAVALGLTSCNVNRPCLSRTSSGILPSQQLQVMGFVERNGSLDATIPRLVGSTVEVLNDLRLRSFLRQGHVVYRFRSTVVDDEKTSRIGVLNMNPRAHEEVVNTDRRDPLRAAPPVPGACPAWRGRRLPVCL